MGQGSSREGPGPPRTNQRSTRRTNSRPASIAFMPNPLNPNPFHREAPPPSGDQNRRHSLTLADLLNRPRAQHEPRSESPSRRRSRLHRARSSVTTHMPNFISRRVSTITERRRTHTPGPTPLTTLQESSNDSDPSSSSPATGLPQVESGPDLNLNFEERSSTSQGGGSLPNTADGSYRPGSGLTDRIHALSRSRELSRLTASIRRRRARRGIPNEDNTAMLSRLLSMAAAATAASLMGASPENAVNDLRRAATHVEGDDGTFDHFLQTLRNGQLVNHLGANDGSSENGGEGQSNRSLDFFRMFRFGTQNQTRPRNPDTSRPTSSGSGVAGATSSQGGEGNNGEEDDVERMVPVLIVGIRSLNADQETGPDHNDAMPSFIDALTSFPTTVNIGLSNQSPTPQPQPERPLSPHLTTTPTWRERRNGRVFSPRDSHRRNPLSGLTRPQSEIIDSSTSSNTSSPHPPPASPSSRPLSSLSSGTTTRPVSLTGTGTSSREGLSQTPSDQAGLRNSRVFSDMEDPTVSNPTQPRPQSLYDRPRHRSGSARRRGIVAPEPPPGDREGNRSWIIYVLGGSYPENHPILSTPSLFTDQPSYEDMLLLSSILGPAKPPVASSEDVDASGGLFNFIDETTALSLEGDEKLIVASTENCLVCLSGYQPSEVARRLNTCGHIFHRDCIDQWLTTGRNACPLCREQGVEEKSAPNPQASGDPGPSEGDENLFGVAGMNA
ncbi:MAG: hypothetical protein M1831_005195 [Alyxoria varia]|nr:MAG: hypothetical protein M1831_005195 [Alyxoria varia]